MNGLNMTKEIKSIDKRTPIIISTAFNDAKLMQKAISYNVDAYIFKPIDLNKLIETLETLSQNLVNDNLFSQQKKILTEYKKAVDASAIVTKTDAKGIITYVNEPFCKISGYSQEELIGKNHNIVRHPDVILKFI